MAIRRTKIATSLVSRLVRWRSTALVGRAKTVSLATADALGTALCGRCKESLPC